MQTPFWLRQRIHPVYLLAVLCSGVLAGALVARFWATGWLLSPWWFVVYGLLVALLLWRSSRWGVMAIALVGCMIGYTRGAGEMVQIRAVQAHFGQTVTLQGVVSEDVSTTKSGATAVRLSDGIINTQPVAGEYWIVLRSEKAKNLKRSDIVTVSGTLQAGFGSLAGSMYRAEVASVKREPLRDPFVALRDWFSSGISAHIPNPEAALGAGYVLGQKRALPPDFEEALRIVGLTHVVVASGYNLTILVRLARRLFAKISRYMAALAGGSMAALFIGITGLSPSMTRAGLVAGISLLVWYYGRQIHPVVLLLLVAAASVLVQPSYIWGDVGWLLSFASFAGVMLLAPVLQVYFFGKQNSGTVRQILGETFSAQLLTMPIIIVLFGTVSNTALLANLLVLPLVPLAMLLVFISGITALWLPWIAGAVALPAYWLLHYMTGVVTTLANVSWASFEVSFGMEFAIACYGVIILLIVWLHRQTKLNYRDVNIVE